jgi:predicted Zn-dependent protease
MKKQILASLFLLAAATSQAQNIQKDIALGKQYSEQVEKSVGIYENPELTAYIKAVGDKLTAQMEEPLFEYKYTILATPEPNAFSIPGGHLYITTGMFPFLESEDELACIMAHEIIHANNRHVIKSNRKGIIPGILQIPGAIIGAVIDESIGNALQSPFQQLGLLTHASYNRRQETEADLKGVEIAAKAGYDPNALKAILSRIGEYGEIVSGEAEEKNVYASNPMTDDRVAKIDKLVPNLVIGENFYLATNFLEKFDGALAGSDPSNGVFVEQTFLNPTVGFKLVFPEDWESGFMGNLIAGANLENKEYMRVTFEESEVNPTDAAQTYLEGLSPYAKEAVIGSEPVSVGDKIGHIVAFKEGAGEEVYYGSRTWVKQEGLLFSFMAVSTSEDQTKMEEILYSLSNLSEDDIQTIEVSTLKLVSAQENETAVSLIERTKAELSEAVTLLINQKKVGELFQKGETVKVVVPEKL